VKYKSSRKREIIKIRDEVNEIETKKKKYKESTNHNLVLWKK
jgi:hypothetical protein